MQGPRDDGDEQTLEPGALIAGRYRVERCLGREGMGVVYAAHDVSADRKLALKRMLAAQRAARAASVAFMREYQLLAQLRHPRIIEVYDYGLDADVPYYTMELLLGQDLRELAPCPLHR
jgi:serine/threonine protein kinase